MLLGKLIVPVAQLMLNPEGEAENVPPVVPVSLTVADPELLQLLDRLILYIMLVATGGVLAFIIALPVMVDLQAVKTFTAVTV